MNTSGTHHLSLPFSFGPLPNHSGGGSDTYSFCIDRVGHERYREIQHKETDKQDVSEMRDTRTCTTFLRTTRISHAAEQKQHTQHWIFARRDGHRERERVPGARVSIKHVTNDHLYMARTLCLSIRDPKLLHTHTHTHRAQRTACSRKAGTHVSGNPLDGSHDACLSALRNAAC